MKLDIFQTAVAVAGPSGALAFIVCCSMLALCFKVLEQTDNLPKHESARIIRLMLWLFFALAFYLFRNLAAL